jgi:hypothetical protein
MTRTVAVLALALTGALACAGARGLPKGPPPEYEEDPTPAPTPAEAGTAPPAPH